MHGGGDDTGSFDVRPEPPQDNGLVSPSRFLVCVLQSNDTISNSTADTVFSNTAYETVTSLSPLYLANK